MYGSSNYYDEMGLAKAWMAKATGDPADLEAAKSIYDQYASNLDYNSAWINWDDKTPAFVAMMCELTGESKHCDQLKSWWEEIKFVWKRKLHCVQVRWKDRRVALLSQGRNLHRQMGKPEVTIIVPLLFRCDSIS